MRRALVVLFVALLARPGAAHGQRPAYAASVLAELDSATSAHLLRELEHASGRGLPLEPLLAKAREGRLKRAPAARIRQAVSALAVRLDSARAALGAAATPDEVVAGADALAAGATGESLRAVRLAGSHGPVTVSLGALTQLCASGVPARRATSMIVDLIRRNVTAAQVVAFGNAVEADAAGGIPGEESAQFRMRAASTSSLGASADAASPGAVSAPGPPVPRPAGPRRRP